MATRYNYTGGIVTDGLVLNTNNILKYLQGCGKKYYKTPSSPKEDLVFNIYNKS
jgi:hypothetical protein